jgi:hypothetical protein
VGVEKLRLTEQFSIALIRELRELWPAYNPNLAPPQVSTQGLFQQTRLIASIITNHPCGPKWAVSISDFFQ